MFIREREEGECRAHLGFGRLEDRKNGKPVNNHEQLQLEQAG